MLVSVGPFIVGGVVEMGLVKSCRSVEDRKGGSEQCEGRGEMALSSLPSLAAAASVSWGSASSQLDRRTGTGHTVEGRGAKEKQRKGGTDKQEKQGEETGSGAREKTEKSKG